MKPQNPYTVFCTTILTLICIAMVFGGLSCNKPTEAKEPTEAKQPTAAQQEEDTMPFKLTSPAFLEGKAIPKKYTGEGLDVSPPLRWSDPPAAVKSFALICDDPDAPMGTWVHWVIYNVPPASRELPEAVPAKAELPDGIRQGLNDFRKVGYGGPMPPPGKPHRYFFKLYALDTIVDLPKEEKKSHLERAMKGHVLADAKLMGTYQR